MCTGIKTLTPQEPNERGKKNFVNIVIHRLKKSIKIILYNCYIK